MLPLPDTVSAHTSNMSETLRWHFPDTGEMFSWENLARAVTAINSNRASELRPLSTALLLEELDSLVDASNRMQRSDAADEYYFDYVIDDSGLDQLMVYIWSDNTRSEPCLVFLGGKFQMQLK